MLWGKPIRIFSRTSSRPTTTRCLFFSDLRCGRIVDDRSRDCVRARVTDGGERRSLAPRVSRLICLRRDILFSYGPRNTDHTVASNREWAGTFVAATLMSNINKAPRRSA